MKRIPQTIAMLLTLAAPHAAMAHPGHHGAMTPQNLVDHLWTSPFHAFPLVLAGFAIAGLVLGLRRANRLSTRKNHLASTAKRDKKQTR